MPSTSQDVASQQAQAASMDTLEAAINSILLNVGSVFADRSIGDSDSLAASKRRLQDALPTAADNYHGALDTLEAQLTRAKAVLYRDYKLQQQQQRAAPPSPPPTADGPAAATAAADAKTGESSSDDFEIINGPDIAMPDAPADTKPAVPTDTPAAAVPQSAPMAKSVSRTSGGKPEPEASGKVDAESAKPLTPAADGQGNNALGIQVAADAKAESHASPAETGGAAKASPKDAASDNGFNDLLPGLSMYAANDPAHDPGSLLEMENMNDAGLGGAFGGDDDEPAFDEGLFGDLELENEGNSFAELLDATGGQAGQESMDVFSDDFFNLNG